jgi:tRNA modification GTPase
VAELHVPGCAAVAAGLAADLARAGARPAGPGEFTARAFFAGRIDLSEAEAVADLIAAEDDARLRAAVEALSGQVRRLCAAAAGGLADVLAAVEASIDLADEGLRFDAPGELAGRASAIAGELRAAVGQAHDVPDAAASPRVVLAGRPNVGKSSLLNALTGTDRAIVSATAGTTRDVLSAAMRLPDAPAVIVQDAAGFAAAADPLTAAAHRAARRAVERADLIAFVIDAGADDNDFAADAALLAEVRAANARAAVMLLVNKSDPQRGQSPFLTERDASCCLRNGASPRSCGPCYPTSAVTGDGLNAVRRAVVEHLGLTARRSPAGLGLHERQKLCLEAAARAAERAAGLLAAAAEVADVAELAAVELHEALAELGAVTGQVVTEEILGRIFARFCVGK